jgi:hypothetical protein
VIALLLRLILLTHATHAPPAHVLAAALTETPELPAELLLAQSERESRWNASAINRVEHGKRRGGLWPINRKFPSHWKPPFMCGPSQIRRLTERSCKALALDLRASYQEAREHIEAWLGFCERTKRPLPRAQALDCALAGYGGGIKATRSKGRAWRYGQATQRLARAYRSRIHRLLTELARS